MINRYPLVCFFETGLTSRIRTVQQELGDLTGSTASLLEWEPHISVGSEIWLDDSLENTYIQQLQRAVRDIGPIRLKVADYGFMDDWPGGKLAGNTPFVVYMNVEVDPELLRLVMAIRAVTDKHEKYYEMPLPYDPHITVAYKDLTREGFEKAKSYLAGKPVSLTTDIRSFSLVKHTEAGSNDELTVIHL